MQMLGNIYCYLSRSFAQMKKIAYIPIGLVRWIVFGKICGLPRRLTGSIWEINFCLYSLFYTGTVGIRTTLIIDVLCITKLFQIFW